jgi:hypothetical protein
VGHTAHQCAATEAGGGVVLPGSATCAASPCATGAPTGRAGAGAAATAGRCSAERILSIR